MSSQHSIREPSSYLSVNICKNASEDEDEASVSMAITDHVNLPKSQSSTSWRRC